ncbi:hypothetical protein TIFTF001_029536 [Ficus carica]|uniref:Uncharacterized protein n=1 Tax=Ficus carica TaxID=3494 RepID=A0AA88J2Z7_FICCA|nr:hypothetical protein TIFTF001_029536 [Ficus carica]
MGRIYTRVTELEPEDKYTVEVVGLGQELTGRRGSGRRQTINNISKWERENKANNRSYCYAADARWDGGTATDSSTWAPELRKARFGHRSQAGVRQKNMGDSTHSKPCWVYCITVQIDIEDELVCQTI